MILQGKEYNDKRMEIENEKVKQLERELAEMTDSRDEASNALQEAIDKIKHGNKWDTTRHMQAAIARWLRAAGMEEQ